MPTIAPKILAKWKSPAVITLGILVVACAVPGWLYLFRRDTSIFAAALWANNQTARNDVIIFRPNHRWDMTDYPYNPVFAYYSNRATFVWTCNTPEKIKQIALERARFAVVTLPPPLPPRWLQVIQRLRGSYVPKLEPKDWLTANGFHEAVQQEGFAVYKRQ